MGQKPVITIMYQSGEKVRDIDWSALCGCEIYMTEFWGDEMLWFHKELTSDEIKAYADILQDYIDDRATFYPNEDPWFEASRGYELPVFTFELETHILKLEPPVYG